jgi:hypothetical protein
MPQQPKAERRCEGFASAAPEVIGENCRMKCEMSACGSAKKSDLERPLSFWRSDVNR